MAIALSSRRSTRTPSYRRQKEHHCADRAFVVLNGRRIHLGEYGTPESREQYDRLIAEWLAGGRILPVAIPDSGLTVSGVLARFWLHAEKHYRKPDGTPTSEVDNMRQAMRPVRQLYGSAKAVEFGPLALKAVRQHMIGLGWARTHINRSIDRVKLVFKWATANELVPASINEALQAVTGLQRGRTEARESERVEPVAMEHVDAIRPYISRQVEALIDLQLLTGARPGELLELRAVDLDTSDAVWTYRPEQHKTAYRGDKRQIFFGPKSQEILKRFMTGHPVAAYLFSPRYAEQERHAKAEKHRRLDQKPNSKLTDREVGDHYTRDSYRRAIARACDRADTWLKGGKVIGNDDRLVPQWHPHQLRHTAATQLRQEFGIDVAQTVLGHKMGSGITELYAAASVTKAKTAVLKVG